MDDRFNAALLSAFFRPPAGSMTPLWLSTGGFGQSVNITLPKALFLLRKVIARVRFKGRFAPLGAKIDFNAVVTGFGRRCFGIHSHVADRIDISIWF
jgi:hypothetical protein